ncbi:MAG: hypothetical protein KA154_09640 [Gemmatimonadaceae bacterium]|nr:hypothetical protein [Gemmatimonadaceae bacterium]
MLADTVDMQNDKSHVSPERFAAFDHDRPTTDELAHLVGCAICRAERNAYLNLQTMASALSGPTAPDAPRLTDWERLAGALRRDGLLTSPVEPAPDDVPLVVPLAARSAERMVVETPAARVTPAFRGTPVWLRIAAAVLLTAGGTVFGRLTAGGSLLPLGTATSGSSAGDPAASALASIEGTSFSSVQQASELLYRAQHDYERASLWLAANDTSVHDSDVYRARLAALDQMMAASRAALREAPQDPVLNRYFLAAYTAREATLQALGGTLPVDKTLERY